MSAKDLQTRAEAWLKARMKRLTPRQRLGLVTVLLLVYAAVALMILFGGMRSRETSIPAVEHLRQPLLPERSLLTHDCSTCGAACSSRTAAPEHDAPNPNSSVKKVIGVVSGKGGVGKSMTSALLACAMARRGYHCGILDADITGPSIPKLFGIHGRAMADEKGCWPIQSRMGIDVMSINLLVENEEDPVVWRGPVIAGAVKQFWTDVVWKDVDFLFVDMPPGTGDVPLTVFQSLPVDGIVVVASPQELVSMIVAKAVNMAEMMKVPMLGIVENMSYIVCPDCGKKISVFGESHVDEVAAKHGLPVLAKCPIDPQLAACSDAGMIEAYPGQYLEGAADACEKLLKK